MARMDGDSSIEKIHQTVKKRLTTIPNTLKFVKTTPLCVVLSTFFLRFGNVVKYILSCLIYYISEGPKY